MTNKLCFSFSFVCFNLLIQIQPTYYLFQNKFCWMMSFSENLYVREAIKNAKFSTSKPNCMYNELNIVLNDSTSLFTFICRSRTNKLNCHCYSSLDKHWSSIHISMSVCVTEFHLLQTMMSHHFHQEHLNPQLHVGFFFNLQHSPSP